MPSTERPSVWPAGGYRALISHVTERFPRRQALDPIDTRRLIPLDSSLDRELIADDGTVSVKNGHIKLARPYWEAVGVKPQVIDQLVDADSKLIFRVPDEEIDSLLQQDPLSAGLRMIDLLSILYDNNHYPLHDSVKRVKEGKVFGVDGMNAHGRQHVRTVTQGVDTLLQQASHFRQDITHRTQLEADLAAAGHDSGQMLTRQGQEFASVAILDHTMPRLKQIDPDLYRAITRAIIIHPEANVTDLIQNVWKTEGNSEATIEKMATQLTPGELALIIADKLHVGQDRLPSIWRESAGILRDLHVGVNAAFSVDEAGYTQDGQTFRIHMSYNPGLETSYFAEVNGFTQDVIHPALKSSSRFENGRFVMPDAIHQYLQYGKASHSEVIEALMWSEHGYKDRFRIAMEAAFALVPNTQTIEVQISDEDAEKGLRGHLPAEMIEAVKHRTYTFTRTHLNEELDAIQQKFEAKGIDIAALREAGKELAPTAERRSA